MKIADYLMVGADHPTRGSDLAAMTGLPLRKVVKLIERERRSGVPICASTRSPNIGYYLAETRDDMLNYCNVLLHREREMAQTRRACMAAASKMRKGA